jgi:hypothetical protein
MIKNSQIKTIGGKKFPWIKFLIQVSDFYVGPVRYEIKFRRYVSVIAGVSRLSMMLIEHLEVLVV